MALRREIASGPEPAHLIPASRQGVPVSTGRFPCGFGRRFFVLLLLGLVWLGPGWWEPRFLYGMVVWDALVGLIWLWDFSRLPRPALLTVRREWQAAVALDTPTVVRVSVENSGPVTVHVVAVDDVPPELGRLPATVDLTAPAGGEGTATYEVLPQQRGDCQPGSMYLRCETPLRVAQRWCVADLNQTVRVYPDFHEARRHTIYLIRSRQIELEQRRKRIRGLGREFESLRDARQGDEWRDICWTASARRAKLITKLYHVERSQAVWVVVDAGRLLRTRIGRISKLDYAVNAALGLIHVALYSGDRVGLLAYGRKIQYRLPAGRGRAHLRQAVEHLALVRGEASEADHLRAARDLLKAQKRRCLVVWLTDLAETSATPDVIDGALQIARRHLVLFAVLAQPELAHMAARRPENREQMYSSMAAQEMVQRRELLLRSLQQRGAMAMELAPGHLASALVNQYLEVKERSLL